MKNRLLIAAGIVVIIIGAVFALQGFGVIEGSAMSNNHTFEVVGPLVALAGRGTADPPRSDGPARRDDAPVRAASRAGCCARCQ